MGKERVVVKTLEPDVQVATTTKSPSKGEIVSQALSKLSASKRKAALKASDAKTGSEWTVKQSLPMDSSDRLSPRNTKTSNNSKKGSLEQGMLCVATSKMVESYRFKHHIKEVEDVVLTFAEPTSDAEEKRWQPFIDTAEMMIIAYEDAVEDTWKEVFIESKDMKIDLSIKGKTNEQGFADVDDLDGVVDPYSNQFGGGSEHLRALDGDQTAKGSIQAQSLAMLDDSEGSLGLAVDGATKSELQPLICGSPRE